MPDEQQVTEDRASAEEQQVSSNSSSAAKELEDLLTLAEKSRAANDLLSDQLQTARVFSFGGLITGYLLLALAWFLWNQTAKLSGGAALPSDLAMTGFAALFGTVLMIWSAFQLQKSGRIKRQLTTEQLVHYKLISLIDDQFRRVKLEKSMSTVARAIIEMRMARLRL